MDIREVFDQLRTYYTKNVKPFEKLPEVIDAAIQVIEHELPAARKELERLTQGRDALRASMPDVERAVADATARVTTAQEAATAAEAASGQRIARAEQAAGERETGLRRDFEFQAATLEREHTARRTALEEAITGLDAYKKELEDAVAGIEAKFRR